MNIGFGFGFGFECTEFCHKSVIMAASNSWAQKALGPLLLVRARVANYSLLPAPNYMVWWDGSGNAPKKGEAIMGRKMFCRHNWFGIVSLKSCVK